MAFGVSAEILFEVDVMRDMMACESRDFGRGIGAVILWCFLGGSDGGSVYETD